MVESAAFEIAKQLFLLGLHSYTSLESSTQALCAKYLGRNDPGNAKGVLLRLVQVSLSIRASTNNIVSGSDCEFDELTSHLCTATTSA